MDALTDQQLLRSYAEQRSEQAFSELVKRHVDLVYSVALRMVRDGDASKDVAQEVFVELARNAKRLGGHPVLAGWLHQTARNLAANVVRAGARRDIREQEAATMSEILASQTDLDWEQIAPQLDDALSGLSQSDREAVLLRYFQRKSAQEMGRTLGISAEAAQKRVNRAVERLRELFAKRGVVIGAGGLAAAVSAHAVQAAPAGLAASISTAAGAAAAVFTASSMTRTIAMTTMQKTVAAATLAVVAGFGIYQAREASSLRHRNEQLEQRQDSLARQLQNERGDATNRLASLGNELELLKKNAKDLPRLRSEVTRLRGAALELAQLKSAGAGQDTDATTTAMRAWRDRVKLLRDKLDRMPEQQIPELQLLQEDDWLAATKGPGSVDSDRNILAAFGILRSEAKIKLGSLMSDALRDYVQANNGMLPAEVSQLQPYLGTPAWFDSGNQLDPSILTRYKMLHTGPLANVPRGQWLIKETVPANPPDQGGVSNDLPLHVAVGAWSTGLD